VKAAMEILGLSRSSLLPAGARDDRLQVTCFFTNETEMG
jgi:hypothetical protein